MRLHLACSLLGFASATAFAIEPLPRESGWHGYLSPSLAAMEFRDNLVAGAGSLDVGSRRIESLDAKPEKESVGSLSLAGEVGYCFAEQGVYLFLGNRLEDFLRLDNASALGARFDLDRIGLLEASAIFPALATEVWEDPYLTGADREETDRKSSGVRLGLAQILGSPWEANVTVRAVEVDVERSGEALGLAPADRERLERDGTAARFELLYTWKLNERHALVPSADFGAYDAEGAAIRRTGGGVQLTHAYQHGRYSLVSNVAWHRSSYEEENPVFGEKQDEDEVVVSTSGFYGRLFGIPSLSGMVSLLYADRDSRIAFFDSAARVASLGVLYQF